MKIIVRYREFQKGLSKGELKKKLRVKYGKKHIKYLMPSEIPL
jgi:hypothetical protein